MPEGKIFWLKMSEKGLDIYYLGPSAEKVTLLGSSENEEKRKGPGIKEKVVRKRKVLEQGIDGINKRLSKVSKLGQGI